MLAGPIKHWWDEPNTDIHDRYLKWRDLMSYLLVRNGHLVYRPHEAWKGPWDEMAQAINDMAVYICDVIVNLCPYGIPSEGTGLEMTICRHLGKPVVEAPPPDDFYLFADEARRYVVTLA